MDDQVEIGVFAAGEGPGLGEPLYLEQHRIRSGEQTIRITVLREPYRAGIDPYHKLIDHQGGDNVVELGTRDGAGYGEADRSRDVAGDARRAGTQGDSNLNYLIQSQTARGPLRP